MIDFQLWCKKNFGKKALLGEVYSCCILICRCMQNNKDEWHSSLEKYTSHFIWKGCVWEGVGDRIELQHIDPYSSGHNSVSFPFSWAAQPGAWVGEASLGHGSHSSIFSPTDWTSCPLSYIIVQRPPSSCGHHNFALIQSVHGKGYILIFLDRMHLLFTLVHFLFWQPGQVRGPYTT